MIIVAFLQNQWFRNPERVETIFRRNPERRQALLRRFLFAGGLTGRRLRDAFGSRCEAIYWEEVSPRIGGHSASRFPADPHHIRQVLEAQKPRVVLAFGAVAVKSVRPIVKTCPWNTFFIECCHPAARGEDISRRLRIAAGTLAQIMELEEACSSCPGASGRKSPSAA